MIEREHEYRRWAELMDRRAAGEPLSADELAFCDHFSVEHPACARENELLAELADLDASPTEESRAVVDAALERLAADAARAERVELSRLRGRGRGSRAWLFGGAAAAAAVVAFVWALPRKEAPQPPVARPSPQSQRVELVYVSGDVRVNGVRLPIGSSALLAEGSRVSVASGSAACVAMDPDIDVCAGEGSELLLSRTRTPWRRLDLVRGKVGVQLEPQPEGYRFSVVANDVWSTAVGTAFTVANEGERGVRTTVLHGKVRVGHDLGREQLVGAHQRADVVGTNASLVQVGRSEESSEWALLQPASLWHNPVASTLVLHGEPAAADVLLDDRLIGRSPLSTLIPAGNHRLQVRAPGRISLERELASEVGKLSTVTYDLAALQVEEHAPSAARAKRARGRRVARATEEAAATSADSAAEMLREAHRLMRADSFEAAAKQYEALRAQHPESPEANTVLVSLAELQLDRLGRPGAALDNLERYLSGRSLGLAEEARQVRIRALRALGEREGEIEAIQEFLRLHSRSFRAAALQRRLSELQGAR